MSYKLFSSSAIMSSKDHDKMIEELSEKIANELEAQISDATRTGADELVEKIKGTKSFTERPYLTSYDFKVIAEKVGKNLQEKISDVLTPVGVELNRGDYFQAGATGLENIDQGTPELPAPHSETPSELEEEEKLPPEEKKVSFLKRMMDKIKGKPHRTDFLHPTEEYKRQAAEGVKGRKFVDGEEVIDDSDLLEKPTEEEDLDFDDDFWDMYTNMVHSGVEEDKKKNKYNGCNVSGYEDGMDPVAQPAGNTTSAIASSIKLSGKVPVSIGTAYKANGGNVSNLDISGSDIDLYIDTDKALTILEAQSLGRDQFEIIQLDDPNNFFQFGEGDIVKGDSIRNILIKMALTN